MRYYVTKWVTTRGILALEGSPPEYRRNSRHRFTSIEGLGLGRRLATLIVDVEAFLSLAEARKDAQKRIELRYRKAQAELRLITSSRERLLKGERIAVHKMPAAVNNCHLFKP